MALDAATYVLCDTCGYAWRSALPSGQIPVKCAGCKNINASLRKITRAEYEAIKTTAAPEPRATPATKPVGSMIRSLATAPPPQPATPTAAQVLANDTGKAEATPTPTPAPPPPAPPSVPLSPTAQALQARIQSLEAQTVEKPPSSLAAAAGAMVGKTPEAVDLLREVHKSATGNEKDAIDKLNDFMEKNQPTIHLIISAVQGGVEAAQRNAEAKTSAMLKAVELQHQRDLEKLRLQFELERELAYMRQPQQSVAEVASQAPQWVPLASLPMDERLRIMNSPTLRKQIVNGMVPTGGHAPAPAAFQAPPPAYAPTLAPAPSPGPAPGAGGDDAVLARVRAWEANKRGGAAFTPAPPPPPPAPEAPRDITLPPAPAPPQQPPQEEEPHSGGAAPAGDPAPLLPEPKDMLSDYEAHMLGETTTEETPAPPAQEEAAPATKRSSTQHLKPVRVNEGKYRCPVQGCEYTSHKQGHVRNHIQLAHSRSTKETATMPQAPPPTNEELAQVANVIRSIPVDKLDQLREENASLLDQPVSILEPMLPKKLTGGALWPFFKNAPIRSALSQLKDDTRRTILSLDTPGLRALVAEADPNFIPAFDRNADWLDAQFAELKRNIGGGA